MRERDSQHTELPGDDLDGAGRGDHPQDAPRGAGDTGDGGDWLAGRFEEQRPYLRSVAYRMLGSLTEADDAVQETWLRLARSDAGGIDNLRGWLTTVVSRLCLNVLRSRAARPVEPLGGRLPDPVISLPDEAPGPEQEAVLADSVGLALLVVLDTLTPPERLAFVLHDLFGVPFEEIAPMVGRSVDATRQLASRARRRVRGTGGGGGGDADGTVPLPAEDRARQRAVVEAFFAAARGGDFDGLLAVLDPDVVLRADLGAHPAPALAAAAGVHRGAHTVARGALRSAAPGSVLHPVLVNGVPGVVATLHGRPLAVMAFMVTAGRITGIDAWAGPDRVGSLVLPLLGG
jgi:RNA polymerase sigma-70 factor (ECF subfamily)